MKIVESVHVAGKPVGMIHQDSNTGQFSFSPIRGKSPLSDKQWRNVDELKQAVIRAYSQTKESPATTGLPILTENINLNHPKEVPTDAYA